MATEPGVYKNFYPPAGSVEVVGDPNWNWDGRTFQHRVYDQRSRRWMQRVESPTGRQLRGKPGTSMASWYYDWNRAAWINPAQGGWDPQRRRPQPQPRPQPPVVVIDGRQKITPKTEETDMSCNKSQPHNIWEGILKHPLLPVAGVGLLVVSRFLKRPEPPAIPDGLPDNLAKWWQMNYSQNLAIWEDKRDFFNQAGQALLTIGTSNAAISVEQLMMMAGAPQKKAA
jgi:hypothetical protein